MFYVIFSAISGSIILISIVFTVVYYNGVTAEIKENLRTMAVRLSIMLDETANTTGLLTRLDVTNNSRITYIDTDGTVIYDSLADINTMGNHSDRPEVIQALEKGIGESVRESRTIGKENFYTAARLQSGKIVRVANTTASMYTILNDVIWWMLVALVPVIILSVVISRSLTRSLIEPLQSLNLQNPLENNTYEELSPLLRRIDEQNKEISLKVGELTAKKRELETIAENMSEGLVILNHNGHIVLANDSSLKIFGYTGPIPSGSGYLQLCREEAFIHSAEAALAGNTNSVNITLGDHVYKLFSNPTDNNAAILFLIDITDEHRGETIRKEFSANVSHELKTPLASIAAYAELIESGVAKPEDITGFAAQIRMESARLLSLINDIIRLSELDEQELIDSFTDVNLRDVCLSAVSDLKKAADEKNITIEAKCEPVIVTGIPSVLYEMVYNIIDNAIRYNKISGKIKLQLYKNSNRIVLTVSDTGIGIPQDQLDRIFERFYRVDKSHSRETGGTGLGLSIVKHAARLHNGEVDIKSSVDKGTEITILFITE